MAPLAGEVSSETSHSRRDSTLNTQATKKRLATGVAALAIIAAPLVFAAPAQASNECQHFTHTHYHFPYAHRDSHRYDGSHWHYDNFHYHHYYNENHTTPYEKKC